MTVGEAFLSAFLQVLFDRLASPELLNFARREGLETKLNKLRQRLSRTWTVLDDAEEKQHNDGAVKKWLDDLRDFADDAEDILDELATEALKPKLTGGNQASAGEPWNFIPTWLTNITRAVVGTFDCELRFKIMEITDRFDNLVKQKDELNLRHSADGRRSDRRRERLAPTSVSTERQLHGRKKAKEEVIQKLLRSEERSDAVFSVISILGMGGLGKTTLMQHVFHDEQVETTFSLRAWAYVSEDFDVVRVTKAILRSVTSKDFEANNDLNSLQVELRKQLKGKKFLVILDDLWNENYHDWTILTAPFQTGAPGSWIVITTRNEGVALTASTVPVYRLEVLSYDACLSLFCQHALQARDFDAHLNLKEIGEKIVERCKGLPLAAKTLGGFLRTTRDSDEWEEVLNSKVWYIPAEKGGILPFLMLSYCYLPSHLKRCFEYCSLFPKGYEFEEEQLVLLWMAEGLIQPRENKKQMEVLGREYFRSLLSRSFFQQSTHYNQVVFLMHDFINDLAQSVARDTCFRIEDKIEGGRGKFPRRARHLSYFSGKYDGTRKFEAFSEVTRLRTLLSLSPHYLPTSYLSYDVLMLLPNLQYLRVLSLKGYKIVELPDSIGDLKLVRYLDLSYTHIKSLPESITTLYNLQTLILQCCYNLKELPSRLGNLVNLRHLNVHSNSLKGMPLGIGKLTCLQKLYNFVVGKSNYAAIKELGPLVHLQGILHISRLENVIDPEDAGEAKLIGKANLIALALEWSRRLDVSQGSATAMEILNMLQPHEALRELIVKGYGGTRFPTWFSGPSFLNMETLRIYNCKNCTSLPPIGQLQSLKILYIKGMDNVKDIGSELYGEGSTKPFTSLKKLGFEDMQGWQNWIPCDEFPNLVHLSIMNCSKLLGKLPNHLPSLQEVVIEGCPQLIVSISSFPQPCKVEIGGLKGVVRGGNVDYSSLNFNYLSRTIELSRQIEGFNMEGLVYVENLTINSCEGLSPLWSSDVGLLQHLPRLQVLNISNCPRLVSLVAEEVEEQLHLGMPSSIRDIEIKDCSALKSLPKGIMYNTSCLERICISNCSSLRSFAIGQLPPTLKQLTIVDCENMQTLLQEDDINSLGTSTCLLQRIGISNCSSLKSLTFHGQLPPALTNLSIVCCPNLESVAERFEHNLPLQYIVMEDCENLRSLPMGMHSLKFLQMIRIKDCPTLVSFPDGGLPPTNLREIEIRRCKKMQGLPNLMHNLTSLQELVIAECSGIASFPAEGLPTSLTKLHICNLNMNEALFEWGLHKLTSLEELSISGGCTGLESFPKMMLPASLVELRINDFPDLRCLSSRGFQFVRSLRHLSITKCKKVTSFPEDGLPCSLLELEISDCPLLKEHCEKDQGREWSKLARIPVVVLEGR